MTLTTLALILLALGLTWLVVDLVRTIRLDGRGHRPPPASRPPWWADDPTSLPHR